MPADGFGRWTLDVDRGEMWLSPQMQAICAVAGFEDTVPLEDFLARIAPVDRPAVEEGLTRFAQSAAPVSGIYRLRTDRHSERTLAFVGVADPGTTRHRKLAGFVVDVTDFVRRAQSRAVDASAEHRAAIEQAKGAIMVAYGMDAEASFQLLRRLSNEANVRLAMVAEAIVKAISAPPRQGFEVSPVHVIGDAVNSLVPQTAATHRHIAELTSRDRTP